MVVVNHVFVHINLEKYGSAIMQSKTKAIELILCLRDYFSRGVVYLKIWMFKDSLENFQQGFFSRGVVYLEIEMFKDALENF